MFGALVTVHAPLWTLVAPAVLMGVTMLNIGALVRARWSSRLARGGPERSTGYSVESTLDEVIFVLGPLVATVLAIHTHPLVTLGLTLAADHGRHPVAGDVAVHRAAGPGPGGR